MNSLTAMSPHCRRKGGCCARRAGVALLLIVSLRTTAGAGDESCWFAGLTYELCCDKRAGPKGNVRCWDPTYTYEKCCRPDEEPFPETPFDCVERDVVLRGHGDHAIFVDVSTHGHKGCFLNDCTNSDKFDAEDWTICSRLCRQVETCTHWTFGKQDGSTKCFLRKSDAGREKKIGWAAGAKSCGPKPLPHGFVVLKILDSEALKLCDGGKDPEKCPDLERALNTWKLALKHFMPVVQGRVDDAFMNQIKQIAGDCDNAANDLVAEYRPTDRDFKRVVFNNRLILNNLRHELERFSKVELSPSDASLPNPLRFGTLCGKKSCYEQ